MTYLTSEPSYPKDCQDVVFVSLSFLKASLLPLHADFDRRMAERPSVLDVILLDITLPGMDGMTVAKKLCEQRNQTRY